MAAAQATEPASGEAPLPLPSPPPRIVRLKVLTLGDTLAGKSCLVKRYCEGRFVAKYIATIGVDYGVRRVGSGGRGGDDGDPVDLRLNFFDTSGVPRYADVRAEFLREAHVALLVFDVGARGGLDGLARWLAELRTGGAAVAGAAGGAMPAPPPPRVLVVGNKADLPTRAVRSEDARAWCMQRGLPYFETSAQSGQGVTELFDAVCATAGV